MPAETNSTVPSAKESDNYNKYPTDSSEELIPREIFKNKKEDLSHKIMPGFRSSKDLPFPVKLHHIVSCVEFEDVISWLPHGYAWRIKDTNAFERKIIPLFFRHCNFNGFMKHVAGWGFKRIPHGSDADSYYHKIFLRDSPVLCLKMNRSKVQGQYSPKNKLALSSLEFSERLHEGYVDKRASSTLKEVQRQHIYDGRSRLIHGNVGLPLNTSSLNVEMSALVRNQNELYRDRDDLQRSQAEISMHTRLHQQPQSNLYSALHQSGFNNIQGPIAGILSVKPIPADSFEDINSLRKAFVDAERKNKVLVATLLATMHQQGKHDSHDMLTQLSSQMIHHQESSVGIIKQKEEHHEDLFIGPSTDQMQWDKGNYSAISYHK